MIIVITVISFLLDGIISKYINPTSIFLPLLTLVSLVIIYPYFKDNYKYFKFISIIGFLYDIVYSNTLFFNFFIFIILGLVIGLINYFLSKNIFINLLETIIVIFLFKMINYLYFILFRTYIPFKMFLLDLKNSLLLNIIWCIILYLITEYYKNKHRIKCYK